MALQRLNFHITDRCQLNCDHCLRDPLSKAIDLDLGLIKSILDQGQSMFAVRHVGLTGGEPTLHPKFYEIIDAIVDRDITWHMVSNGERFDRVLQRLAERPQRLENLAMFNFSLDGATEETHDSIREKGSFRSVMQAASLCRARGLKFLFQITLNARNVDEIEEIALLASQLGAVKMAYNFTQPTGTFLDSSLYLPAGEWRRAVDRIQRAADAFKIEIFYADTGPHEEPFQVCEMWRHASMHVDYRGRLNLCCQHAGVPSEGAELSDVAGDLNDVSLADAHGRFTEIVNHTVKARLETLQRDDLGEWDRHFSCNWCLKQFGRPHWVEDGIDGPKASRARWRGRWAPGYKDSHVEADPGLVQLRVGRTASAE
ncbi:MAG: radical SAM protein [Myxococcales bacterium]|nr:radical SAM protein [Myxococcales bacterium]